MIQLEHEVDPLKRLSLQDFSYSRLSCFNDCQLKYFYSYIIRVPQDFGFPALLGNIIHEALELTLENETNINAFELINEYHAARLRYDPNEDIPDEMIIEGERMLIEFAKLINNKPVKVDATQSDYLFEKEKPFSFVLGRARINGFIDYVSVREDKVFIRDYKSGKREVAGKDVSTNPQLGIYSLFLKYLYPDKPVHAELYYLKSEKAKGHTFSDEELEAIKLKLAESVEEVLNTEDFKPTPAEWKCNWCSYAKDGTCSVGQFRLQKKGKLPWD